MATAVSQCLIKIAHGYSSDHLTQLPYLHCRKQKLFTRPPCLTASLRSNCVSYCRRPSTTYARNFAYLSPIFRASLYSANSWEAFAVVTAITSGLRLRHSSINARWTINMLSSVTRAPSAWAWLAAEKALAISSGDPDVVMKTYYTVGLSMLAGIGIAAVAMQTLHAQGKPPVYVVTEIEVSNVDAYTNEYVPVVRPVLSWLLSVKGLVSSTASPSRPKMS